MPSMTAPEMRVERVLVVVQQLADARHAEPEEHEDRSETEHEQGGRARRRGACCSRAPSSSVARSSPVTIER